MLALPFYSQKSAGQIKMTEQSKVNHKNTSQRGKGALFTSELYPGGHYSRGGQYSLRQLPPTVFVVFAVISKLSLALFTAVPLSGTLLV